jgi:hypothetical protein
MKNSKKKKGGFKKASAIIRIVGNLFGIGIIIASLHGDR